MIKQLLIVFFLGFSSGLPMALVSSTLQAWFAAAGLSIWISGLLSLMSLPYLYRFIWAPLLDRYAILRLGKRRGWILITQLLLCLGFNALTWFSPNSSPMTMACLAFVLASCSATQDTAIDAHRIEYLPRPLHGIGASLAIVGYRIALMVGGGVALVLAQHYGWVITYRIMSGLMLIGMIAVIVSPEPSHFSSERPLASSFIAPLRDLITRPEILPFCLFILFYKFGEAFTTSTSGIIMPFLIQGLGFSLATIGYVNKIWGVVAIIAGGLVGGVMLMRYSLYRSLFVFGVLQAMTNVIFVWLAVAGNQLPILVLAVLSDNFAAGMGTTAVVALLMRFVNQRFTATQFSILAAIAGLPRIVSGPIGAMLQSHYGWKGLYCISSVLALFFIPFLYRVRRQPCFQMTESVKN